MALVSNNRKCPSLTGSPSIVLSVVVRGVTKHFMLAYETK